MITVHRKRRTGQYIALTLAVLLAISVASVMLAAPRALAAETYTWSQSDWSGGAGQGVITGTTNRYDSDNGNVDVSAPGKILLESGAVENAWGFDQPSSYVYDPAKVEISGSVASLVSVLPWMDDGWTSMIPVTVTSGAAPALTEYQVKLEIDSSQAEFWAGVNSDGNDIRVTDDDAVTSIPFWVERFDYAGQQATVWAQVPSLDPGDTTFYLYFGNPAASAAGSALEVFSYSSPQELYYMLFSTGAGQDLLVASYADGNEVDNGSSTLNLDTRNVGTFPGAEIIFGNPISATMPISGRSVANTNDSIVPICFAGTAFAYPTSRGIDVWDVYAPFADASVSIYDGGSATPASTFNVTQGTAVTQTVDVTTVGIVESDVPVLITYRVTNGYDSEVLYPATNELYGISSSRGYVTFMEDNTTLNVYASGGGGTTVVQNRGDRYSVGYGASQGTGEAIHLMADKPIVASSQADADGGESMEFWPAAAECATEYILPGDTQYISGAAIEGETNITVYNPDGSVNTTGTTSGSAPPYPQKLYFGNSSTGSPATIVFQAGTQVVADKPIFLYHEYVDHVTVPDGDETNVLNMKQARKVAYPEPVTSIGAPETHYPDDDPVITGVTVSPYLSVANFTETLGAGTQGTIRYQVWPDGVTYYYHNGLSWQVATAGYTHTSTAVDINANLGTFGGPGELNFRAYLHSDGSQKVELDELKVDCDRYAGTATLTSSTFEPGEESGWKEITWQESKPAGTSVALDVSTDGGNTFQPVLNGQSVDAKSEKFTYRVTMATTDPLVTPETTSVQVTYRNYESPPPPLPPPPKKATKWFFSEGYTGDDSRTGEEFESWVLIQNPNEEQALTRVTFMIPGGEVIYIMDPVLPPHSRYTIRVDDILGLEATEFATSVEVTNNVPVVCERAMYFNYDGKSGGHDTIGATETSTEWYLAEGYTGGEFDTYILVMNPDEKTARVRATFMLPDSKVHIIFEDDVPPHSRYTIPVDTVRGMESTEFSTLVESVNDVPLVCERAIYFDSDGRQGGHVTIGAAATAGKWYMPEGYTGGDFDTWLLLQNPQEERANVRVSFMREDGKVVELDYSLAPRSRETVHLNEIEGLTDAMVSTAVESTNGVDVVCERSMYFEFNGRSGGHNSIGASSGSTWMASEGEEFSSKWCMSEGSAGSGFDTYVLVQNPSDEAARVRFTYMTSTGDTFTEECELPPMSRYTRCLSDVEGLESDAVSTQVESLDGVPIICERSVYFDFTEFQGGHDSIGYALTD